MSEPAQNISDQEKEALKFLERDFNQSFQQMRHYDAQIFDILKFMFEFTSKYEPNVGNILFEGELLYMEEPKIAKEILSDWKKNKKLPKELMAGLLNTILIKCNVQALILSQQVNLPPPIPLPKVQISAPVDKNYIG
mgnify:CR=1 FL=1